MFFEKPNFPAFRAGFEILGHQAGAKHQIKLVDEGQVEKTVGLGVADTRAGFLPGFATGPLDSGFAVFEIAGRKGPQAGPRLDGAAAQENASLPFGDHAHHQFGILVMNLLAGGANMAQPVVPPGDLLVDRAAAIRAEIHR